MHVDPPPVPVDHIARIGVIVADNLLAKGLVTEGTPCPATGMRALHLLTDGRVMLVDDELGYGEVQFTGRAEQTLHDATPCRCQGGGNRAARRAFKAQERRKGGQPTPHPRDTRSW